VSTENVKPNKVENKTLKHRLNHQECNLPNYQEQMLDLQQFSLRQASASLICVWESLMDLGDQVLQGQPEIDCRLNRAYLGGCSQQRKDTKNRLNLKSWGYCKQNGNSRG
jgi:hypothetical protein